MGIRSLHTWSMLVEKNTLQTKLLTSQSTKKSNVVDPKVQVSSDHVEGKGQQDEIEGSRSLRRRYLKPI